MKEYRLRENVRAELIEETGLVFTTTGAQHATAGDYLVHKAGGCYLMNKQYFEDTYIEDESVEENSNTKDETPTAEQGGYNPDNHTVQEVLSYMRKATAEEVDYVKNREREGANRSTILAY